MKKAFWLILIAITIYSCVQKPSSKIKNGWQAFHGHRERFDSILTRDFYKNDILIKREEYLKFYNNPTPKLLSSTSFLRDNIKNGWSIYYSKDGYIDSFYYENNKLTISKNYNSFSRQNQYHRDTTIIDTTWNNNLISEINICTDSAISEYHNDRFANFSTYYSKKLDYKKFNKNGKLSFQQIPKSYPNVKKSNETCQFGLQNSPGKWILPAEYEFISKFCNNKAIVGKNGLNGIVDTSGKFILPIQKYILLEPETVDNSRDGKDLCFYNQNKNYYIFQSNGYKKGLLNIKNGIIFKPEYYKIELKYWEFNIIFLEHDNEQSLADTLGNILQQSRIKYEFNSKDLENGIIKFYFKNKYGLVNLKGKSIISNNYNYISIFSDSNIIAHNQNDSILDIYNLNGVLKHSFKANFFTIISQNRVVLRYKNKFKIINKKGEILVSDIDSVSRVLLANEKITKFILKKADKYYLSDSNGVNFLNTFFENLVQFNSYEHMHQHLIYAKLNGLWGVIDQFGNQAVPFSYKYRSEDVLANDSIAVTKYSKNNYEDVAFTFNDENGIGLVKNNKLILKPIYLKIDTAQNYIELMKKDSSVALANWEGKILIEGKSKRIYATNDGFAQLNHQNISTVFDKNGNKLYAVPGNILATYPEFVYVETQNNKVGVFDKTGKILIDTVYGQIARFDTISNSIWATTHSFGKRDKVEGEEYNEDDSYIAYTSINEMFSVGWDLYNKNGVKIISNAQNPSLFCPQNSTIAVNWGDSTGILNKNLIWNFGPKVGKLTKVDSLYLFYKNPKSTVFSIYNQYGKLISDEKWESYQKLHDFLVVSKNKIPSLLNFKGELEVKGIDNQYNQSRRKINNFINKNIDKTFTEEDNWQYRHLLTSEYDNLTNELSNNKIDTNIIDNILNFLEGKQLYKLDTNLISEEETFDNVEQEEYNTCDIDFTEIDYFPKKDINLFVMMCSFRSDYITYDSEYQNLHSNKNWVSILQSDSYGNRYSQNYNDTIYNFKIKDGKIYPIKLNQIISLTPKNIQKLNQMMAKKVIEYKAENNESICDIKINDYVKKLKKFFYVSDEGIKCYFGNDDVIKDSFSIAENEETEPMEILLSFEELKGLLLISFQ